MTDASDQSVPGETTEGAGGGVTVSVDGFEDFERIGRGGFSSVYSARQVRMGRPVAIKVLDAELGGDDDRRTFERECQAMGVLSRHPNIATVYSDAYTTDGRACLVMELYHGNYRDRLDETGPLALGEFLALGVKIAGALQAAHDTGVLHRDIKPHNIFLSDFGEPALGDFGISTIEGERSITAAAALSVAYSAPEVIEDGVADFLSDVYSLAATLYHLLAGVSPFAAPQVGAVVKRIMSEAPDPVGRADVPRSLQLLLQSGLAKRPSDRPDSAGDLAWSLQDIQAELGYDRTAVPLRRAERLDPDSGADWANSSGESSSRRRATMKAASEAVESPRTSLSITPPPTRPSVPPGTRTDPRDDAEETILPAADHPVEGPESFRPHVATTTPAPGPVDEHAMHRPDLESTVRRGPAGFVRPVEAVDAAGGDRRRGWAVDVAIAVTVVALVAFALSRMS